MLRKMTLVIAGTVILTGAAIAAPTSTFPSSITDAGPNYPAPTAFAPERSAAAGTTAGEVRVPSSVSESMPEMTADLEHPTHMGAARGTSVPRFLRGSGSVAGSLELPPIIGD